MSVVRSCRRGHKNPGIIYGINRYASKDKNKGEWTHFLNQMQKIDQKHKDTQINSLLHQKNINKINLQN